MKDIHKNYKILLKDIKEDLINKKVSHLCSWIGRSNIVKMVMLSNVIYRSKTIPIKFPMTLFAEMKSQSSNSYEIRGT